MIRARAYRKRWMIGAWLVGLALCIAFISRATFTADLSAFLPSSPSKEQRVLLDQLQNGVVSRLILAGIEGSDAPTRAALSKQVAATLRRDAAFSSISNGEPVTTEKDQAFLFENRYVLSSAVTAERFTRVGLQQAIGDTINLLASPAGMLIKPLLPRDPTGEIVHLISGMDAGRAPRMEDGAWSSKDGRRALLLLQTAATGADTDGQQKAIERARDAFDEARRQLGNVAVDTCLVMTGPGVFSVNARATIEKEVTRLSIVSTLLIVTMLFIVYRSITAVALGLLPVLSGALVGVVAVSLGFGLVHGITLGFGTTLIGETVDYSIYLFVQSRQGAASGKKGAAAANENDDPDRWIADFWPTIRLGVMTSIAGFVCLLVSSFPGLAQLGLYSISGLTAAALVTRYVLPHLLPAGFYIRDVSGMGKTIGVAARAAPALRWPLAILVVGAIIVLFEQRGVIWNTELSSLSPVSQADQVMDGQLRADMGAPDVRYMVVASGATPEDALQAAERIGRRLDPLVQQGVLNGFESPARYLPSIATQTARQRDMALAGIKERLDDATAALPVRDGLFEPFLADVAAAAIRTPLQRHDLDGTSFAMAVDSLLFQSGSRWSAVLPLQIPLVGGPDAATPVDNIRSVVAQATDDDAIFVDLKAESDQLYADYLSEAIKLSLAGLGGIVALLLAVLRSPGRVISVLLPLIAAVLSVTALLVLFGQRLTILHLVGLLLIVAVGSNYALFFNSGVAPGNEERASAIAPNTLASLVFANLTTVAGFGLLGFSSVPVLYAIGMTVGPGAVLALLYAAVLAPQQQAGA